MHRIRQLPVGKGQKRNGLRRRGGINGGMNGRGGGATPSTSDSEVEGRNLETNSLGSTLNTSLNLSLEHRTNNSGITPAWRNEARPRRMKNREDVS